MSDTLTTIQSVQVLVCTPDGEKLKSERDALDLIGEAIQQGAEVILLLVERLEHAPQTCPVLSSKPGWSVSRPRIF